MSQCFLHRSIALPTHRKRTKINNIHLRPSKTGARAGTSNMLKHCGTETLDKTSTDIESDAAAAEMPLKPIKTSDSLPDKRIKPVVPAKPAFIPPPPTGRQPHHRTPVVLNDNPVSVSAPVQPAIVPGFVVPSSPNIGCGSSDCCGILSGGTAKQNDNQSTHPPANNNNNNNNNSNQNNNRNGAAAVASVDQPDHCVGGETERRWCRSTSSEQDRTCAQLDAIKKKTMDLDSRLPHKFYEDRRAVQSPASSSSAAVPPNRNNVQNKFFQQSSKQLEQILAQRIEKETLVAAAAAGKTNKKRFGGSASAQTVPVVGTQAAATSAQVTADSTAISTIQKQIQHKLHDEMKKHCKTIQEKHLIEKRWPQQPYRPSTGADCDLQQTVSASFARFFKRYLKNLIMILFSLVFAGSAISSCYHWIENSTEIKGEFDIKQ